MLRMSSRRKVNRVAALTAAGVLSGLSHHVEAANGNWTATTAGNWSTTTNWAGGVVPGDLSGGYANTDIATFNTTPGVVVTIDQATQSIGSLLFTGTVNTSGFQIGATGGTNTLYLGTGGSITNSVTNTGTQTIAAPLSIGGAYTINDSAQSNNFTFSGAITDASTLTITGSGANVSATAATTITGSMANFTGVLNVSTGLYDKLNMTTAGTVPTSATINIGGPSTLNSTFYTNLAYGTGVAFNIYGTGNLENLGALRLDGSGSVAGPVTLETPNASIGSNTGTSTISGNIGGVGGSSFNKGGGGTVVFSGTNTYTGLTTVSAGVLSLNGNESAATGGFFVGNTGTAAATLNISSGGIVVSTNPITMNDSSSSSGSYATINAGVTGTATIANSGTLNVYRLGVLNIGTGAVWNQSGALSVSVNTTSAYNAQMNVNGIFNYNSSTPVTLNPSGSTSAGQGDLVISGGAAVFTTGVGFQNTLASSGGSANLTLSNSGVLALSANIAALTTTSGSAFNIILGSGDGVINTNGFNTTIGQPVTSTGTFTEIGNGIITLTGTNTANGPTEVTLGTLDLSSSLALQKSTLISSGIIFDQSVSSHAFSVGGLSGSFALNLVDNGSNPVALSIGGNNLPAAFSGSLTGSGSFTKTGTALQSLSGSNSYAGTTSITGGTLEFVNETSLYNNTSTSWTSGNITVSSGATFALAVGGTGQFTSANLDTLLANLDTGGSSGLLSGSILGLDTQGSNTFTYADPVTGSIGITKLGSGTLTLSGTNSYSGVTIINAGTLKVNGSATGSGPLTFANTGAFTYTAPSAGGTLALGALTVSAGEATLTSSYTGGTTALSFSSLTSRTAGTALNLVANNGSNGTTNEITISGTSGFINQGTFFNGSNYAYVDSSGFIRGINYAGDSGASTSGATASLSSSTYQQFTGIISGQTSATFTTLNDYGAYNMNVASGAVVVTNGILKSLSGTATFSGGTGFQASNGAELVIRTDTSNALIMSTPILANGTNILTKSGAGTLWLTGTNTYTGATYVDSGTMVVEDTLNDGYSHSDYGVNKSSGITVQAGASLEFLRIQGYTGIPTETYYSPKITLNDGSTLLAGTTTYAITSYFSNAFAINGNVTISNATGTYTTAADNFSSSGAISGSGTINIYGGSGNVRTYTFSGASPSYFGNWTVTSNSTSYPSSLVSGATNALGTGLVTLNANSVLSATVSSGLDSLTGININSSSATLVAPIGMNAPAATVTMSAGNFNVGTGSSAGATTIGTLQQTGGIINLFPTATASDYLNVLGNYNYTGGSINLTFVGTPSAPTYTLVNYSGTLASDPTVNFSVATGSRVSYGVNYGTGKNSSITLVESGNPANLIWTGAISNAWDIDTTQNWNNSGTSSADYFYNYDNVLFNDTATNFNPTIASGTTVLPSSMTFNNSANAYTISGGGAIGGATSLVKNGSAMLTINTTNSYTGGTFLNGGTVVIGAASALGTAPASAAVNITFNGGTLQTTGNATFTATQNVLVNSSGGTIDLDSNAVTVAGVISGTGPLVINNTGNASGGVFTTSAINTDTGILTINNDATVNLANTSTPAGSTQAFSQIVINAGSTLNTVGTHEFGYAASTRPLLNISGGTVDNSGADDNYLGQLIMTGGTVTGLNDYRLQTTTGYSTASVVTLASPNASVISIPSLELVSSTTFNISSGTVANGIDLVVSSNVSGGGLFLQKTGPGVMSLSGSDSYTGGTIVSAGKLILASGTAYPANTSLNVASGAMVTIANHSTFSTYVPQASALINSGTIDVVNNAFLVHNGSIGTITAEVAKAFNNGWTATNLSGGVIISSLAAADATRLTAVGVATGLTSFEGLTVASTDVLVKFTYYGDANLSGTVDGSDYSLIDNAYEMEGWVNGVETNAPISGWYNGDFNYDGNIDGSDYTLIDNAFNSQGANISAQIASPTAEIAPSIGGGVSAVPEPTTLGLVGIGAIGLLGRRRRRH